MSKHLYKIILLGESGVGKSTFLNQIVNKSFSEKPLTIGVDFGCIVVEHKNLVYKLHIWDTAGQEKFNSIISELISDMSLDENIDEEKKRDDENEKNENKSKPENQEQKTKEKDEENEEMSIDTGIPDLENESKESASKD